MKVVPPLLALILFLAVLLLGGGAIRQTDPAYRAAIASEKQANAARAWAAASAAEAAAQAKIDQAPARAAITTGLVAALALVAVALAAALAAALALAAVRRATLIHADTRTGLYPALPEGRAYQVLNETGAQIIAAAAAASGGQLRAPVAGRLLSTVLDQAPTRRPAITVLDPDPLIPAPTRLPQQALIYDATRPPAPALPIGQGEAGPVNLPLKNLGNVLIAGLPGSGKSNLLASIIWSLGAWASSRYVQVAMIDTKRVDFGRLSPDLRIMWRPVAVDLPDGRALIADALAECQRRFAAIDAGGETPPYLVVIIDELADWTGDRQFVETALEIGRKGRAAGVSLVLATQMARADAIDPRLRAVAGASIAMRLRSSADSRMVIGQAGAELLPPTAPGRCLVSRGDIIPAQAYFAGLEAGNPDCEFYRRLAALPHRSIRAASTTAATVVDAVATATTAPEPTPQPQPLRLDRGRAPGPAEIDYIRTRRAHGASLTRICFDLWGYKDGQVWSYVIAALNDSVHLPSI